MSVATLTPPEIRKNNLIQIARVLIGLSVVGIALFVYLGIVTQNWYLYLVAGAFVLVGIISFAIFASRNEIVPVLGTWPVISAISLPILLISAVQSNAGVEFGFTALIAIVLIVIQTLPPEKILRGAVFGVVISLVSVMLAFFSPIPQTPSTTVDPILIWVARGSALMFVALIMTQFRSLNLTNKLLISFLGTVVMISLTFDIVMTTTASNIMTEQVGQGLRAEANARGSQVADYLQGQVEVMQTFALDENIRQSVRQANALKPTLDSIQALDEQWRQGVESGSNNSLINSRLSNSLSNDLRAFQELNPDHVEVFVTDQAGALVSTTNVTSDYYQADEEWWIQTYRDGAGDVYISQPEFDESVGHLSILVSVPIFDTRNKGDLIGILRSTITINALFGILNVPIGETGEIEIFFPDNTVIDYANAGYEELSPESITAIQDTANQTFVRGPLESEDSIMARAQIKSIVQNSKVNVLGWSAIAVQDTAEALAPVYTQVRLVSFFGTIMAGIAALLSLLVSQRLAQPIRSLTETAGKLSEGDFDARAQVTSQDEIGILAQTFNTMTTRLQEILIGLEERVEERTAELQESSEQLRKRATQFEAIAQLARTITSIQELETLLPRITQLVSKQFGFYHVGLFLLDESRQYAVLSAANSEGGQRMLDRKHRLGVGQTGIVGYVTATGNPRIALDTGTDAVYFDNPDLPETRSEMALPLRVGRTIIGALDVQSTEPNAFTEDDVEVLSILADEVSIAIENARLYNESQRILEDAQSAFGEFTQEAWKKTSKGRKVLGYELSGATVRSLNKPTKSSNSTMVVPIKLRNRVIGTMNIALPKNRELDQDEVDITQALAQRVGTAIENATLLEESQRRATRESMIGDISAKLSATADVERLMQVAVRELRHVLGAQEVILKIGSNEEKK